MSQNSHSGSSTISPASSDGVVGGPAQLVHQTNLDSGGSIASDTVLPSPSTVQYCQRCKKTLKTKRGFIQHKALHIQKDCQLPAASADLRQKCQLEADNILQQMREDPAAGPLGEAKKNYIHALLESVLNDSWLQFLSIVLDYLLEIILQRSKVLPQKQHIVNLREINTFLSQKGERENLYDLLNCVVSGDRGIINMVVFRFVTKLYSFAEAEYIRLLALSFRGAAARHGLPTIDLKKDEKETLYYAAGSVVRYYLVKGKNSVESEVQSMRQKCIEEKFLFVEDELYSDELLALKRWFDSLNRGGLVAVNEEFFNFLLKLEVIVRKCLYGENSVNHELVLNELFHVCNEPMLSYWYLVTDSYFGESESLSFLDSVVRRFVEFSAKAEAGLRRRQYEGTSAMKTVATRTDLKRN